MSDASQGPGWWQASDGKWYPPEQAPGAAVPTPPATAPPGYNPAPVIPPGYTAPAAFGSMPGAPGQLAEWGTRVGATLIDGLALAAIYVVGLILGLILGSISSALGAIVLILVYLAALVGGLYFSYLTGETGQSPGKRILGIKVVNEATGQPIGGGNGIARYFIHILDGFCLIGYLFPLWDAKKQTFADKIQTTVVVTGAPKQSFGKGLFTK